MDSPTNITEHITKTALKLFYNSYTSFTPIRSIGVSLTDFSPENTPSQISLFCDERKNRRLESLDSTVDRLKERFGNYSLVTANLLKDPALSRFNPYEEHTVHPVGYF